MPDTSARLGQVFGLQPKTWSQAARDRLSSELRSIQWTAGLPDVTEKIAGLFDLEVPDLLMAAWRKDDELHEALAASEKSPEETTYLELAEHTVRSVHHPKVTIEIDGVRATTLEFTADVSLTLKGAVLRIEEGRITGIRTGSVEAEGQFLYGDLPLLSKSLGPIELPGTIEIPSSTG